MPTYSKFMKELLSNKRSYQEKEVIQLNAICSAILQTDIPHKLKDPGSVTILVTIGEVSIGKALVNLMSTVSLMSLSIMRRIGELQLTPTRMSLQLADISIKYLEGVAEDVLVKVDKFLILVDFAVINISGDVEIPLIMGRPFIRTTKMGIDMENGKLIVRVENDEIRFDIFKAMHHPRDKGQCFQIDNLEEICSEHPLPDNSWEMQELNLEDGENEQLVRNVSDNQISPEISQGGNDKKESEPELKELPLHLKYVLLKGDSHKPVIINNLLSTFDKNKLIQVLEKHQKAIGSTLKDLKGISPSYCMHKIMMENDFIPVAQPHRRNNPIMKEVV
ncbi:PREDICTED: uncharacterized protein LOC109340493 [Lupinus angustifolius]|uniref:uncharacterized protein LOC109340493 n=1 Tax=Lupinus angustifolius TaxID=3871 RepID=UPI00092F691C|nr:PREDICTED: uncharacterized protein LOC109340493 [Lupinus angustifolius]